MQRETELEMRRRQVRAGAVRIALQRQAVREFRKGKMPIDRVRRLLVALTKRHQAQVRYLDRLLRPWGG